jgi:hypothetical protein
MVIGLINLLTIAALGAVLFVFVQMRTGMDLWYPNFVVPGTSATLIAFGATNATLMALSILFAAFLMLVKQSLLHRTVVGIVALCFLVIALSSPGVGHAVGLEHVVAFWFCVLILIPLRALRTWSIHWSEQTTGSAGTGQFTLADLLTWTTAFAATFGFLHVFFGARIHAVPFSAVPVWYVSEVTAASSAAVLAAFVVAGPCLWLAASRYSRVGGSLWITLWVVAASLIWGVAMWFWGNYRASPWGMPWWHMVLYGCESLLYLLALEATLLANLFALEWLGLRWTRAPLRTAPSP